MTVLASRLSIFLSVILLAGCSVDPVDDDLIESTPALSADVAGFRNHLDNTDCMDVRANPAFSLRIMDRNFPLPAGYEFRGFQHIGNKEALWFHKYPTLDVPKYTQDHPGTSIEEAVRKKMDDMANVFYYEQKEAEDLEGEEFPRFEFLQWNGLSILFRATRSEQRKITVYQVVVRVGYHVDRLSLSSTNIEQLTKIIACAEEVDGVDWQDAPGAS